MTTRHDTVTYPSTTHTAIKADYGILVNNTDILVNSEDYYIDGSMVMRNTQVALGIRCNDRVILCNSRDIDCNGATICRNIEY